MKNTIRSEVARLTFIPAEDIHDETPLINKGVLDSFALLGLIEFLESTYQIKIKPRYLNERYFGNLNTLESLIQSLQQESKTN